MNEEVVVSGVPENRPIYVAKSLADAQRLEAALKAANLEYLVEPDTYQGGLIFRSARIGAFFYVDPEERERAEQIMQRSGFTPAK